MSVTLIPCIHWHIGKTESRTQGSRRTQDPIRTRVLWGPRTLGAPRWHRTPWGPRTLWGLIILWWSRKDPRTYKLIKVSWFPHQLFNLVEFTIKGRFIYHCWMQINLTFFVKLALEIKREYSENNDNSEYLLFNSCKNRCYNCYMQLTDKWEFLEYAMNSLDKKMWLLLTKYNCWWNDIYRLAWEYWCNAEEAMGMRKILVHDIRIKKNPQTKDTFWIFTDFHGVLRVESPTCTSARKFHQWRR